MRSEERRRRAWWIAAGIGAAGLVVACWGLGAFGGFGPFVAPDPGGGLDGGDAPPPVLVGSATKRDAGAAVDPAAAGAPEAGKPAAGKRGEVRVRLGPVKQPRPFPDAEVRIEAADGTSLDAVLRDGIGVFPAVPCGDATITVRGAWLVGWPARIEVVEEGLDVLVHATAGGRFRGRVLDDRTGQPIAGARVLVYDGGAFGGTWSNEGGVLCGPFPSDADGRFETEALTLDRTVTIDVVAPGFERARFPTRLQRRAGERPVVDVRLRPGGSVVGTVVDGAGAPVVGATVYVVDATWGRVRRDPRESDLPEGSRLAAVRAYEAKSGGEGRFVVDGVAFGTDGCLAAFVGGIRSREVTGARVVEGKPPPEVRLVLPPSGGLDVVVLGPDRGPVTEGEVSLSEGPHVALARDGIARFRGLPAGVVTVEVRTREYVQVSRPVPIRVASTWTETIVLTRGGTVRGSVVTADGKPGRQVRVTAEPEDRRRGGGMTTWTGADGTFTLSGLVPGPCRVSVEGFDGGAADPARSRIVTPPVDGLRFVVPVRPAVTVRFRAPVGVPLPTVVHVMDEDADRGGGSGGQAAVATDGTVDWPAARGRRRLTWVAAAFAPIETVVDTTTSPAVDLGVRTLDVGVTVDGTVVDVRGVAVPDAEVSSPDFEFEAVEADGDGRFRLEHEPREGRTLEVTARGFVSQWVSPKYDRDPASLRIVLERGGLVRGTVRRKASDRRDFEDGATLTAPSGDVVPADGGVGEDGRFEVRAKPGRYVLRVRLGGAVVLERDVTLTEGSEETIDVAAAK
ncbi:MAG: carboxypeptidase-like regulatory domain-containing protein [Planctomycetota bacterium]